MLTPCIECGSEVSTLAAACPKCGAPVNRKPTTIEQTSKSVKAQLLGAVSVMLFGAWEAVSSGGSPSAAALGGLLFVVGALWLLVVMIIGWWKNG